MATTPTKDAKILAQQDLHLLNEGTHLRLYQKLGAHLTQVDGVEGAHFAVWAPDAARVYVFGDFNKWDKTSYPLHPRGRSGVWEGFIPGVGKGTVYKYHVVSLHRGYRVDKADPFAIRAEVAPRTGSVVWDLDYTWNDEAWLKERTRRSGLDAPVSIYEVHLGSWMRSASEGNRSLTYRELATELVQYVEQMGFTHVELMPITEHPFEGSWGYQTTGYFSPTSRWGTPQDFMFLVDTLHQHGIGVILDWVPSHFPSDEHALRFFDGSHVYEHADPRLGIHPDWGSSIYNYGRNEVRSFLLSSAFFWLDHYHLDGLRVDAVASMLYLDYSRKEGEWIPNRYGGKENLDAMVFLRKLNEEVYKTFPGVQTYAEESTSWPMVSRPTHLGGLGFGLKWDMGWMHDTLNYLSKDPIHRTYHHNMVTFRMLYAFTENYVLPLSHDEVVHGKGSLLGKMPGSRVEQFANLRLLFGYMFGQPAKKLLFMGCEFGQWKEWNHDGSLDWHLLKSEAHAGIQKWVTDLNAFYRAEPALHQLDCSPEGFEWVDCNDSLQCTLCFLRKGTAPDDSILVVCNFTPVPRYNYKVGVPRGGFWKEALNSDAKEYGGRGFGNYGGVEAAPVGHHGRPYSLHITLPPLSVLFFTNQVDKGPKKITSGQRKKGRKDSV